MVFKHAPKGCSDTCAHNIEHFASRELLLANMVVLIANVLQTI